MIKDTEATLAEVQRLLQGSVQSMNSEHFNTVSMVDIQCMNMFAAKIIDIFPGYYYKIFDAGSLQQFKRSWLTALHELGITNMEYIKLGFKRATASGLYNIPAVGKFCEWCQPQPEDVNLPCIDDAFKEARNYYGIADKANWSYPAIYVAAMATGKSGFLSRKPGEALQVFTEHYLKVVKRVFDGEDLSGEIPRVIPKIEPKPATIEVRNKHLRKIRRRLEANKLPNLGCSFNPIIPV